MVRLGPFPTRYGPDRRPEGIYGTPSMGAVAPYQKNRGSKGKESNASRLGQGDPISAKRSNSRRGKAAWTPNSLQTHSMECNECRNAKKEEVKRKEKKAHHGQRRTMPPVRPRIGDSHGERADIGEAFGGVDRAHTYETFEPVASLIERELIDFRQILGLGATRHQKWRWRARYCSARQCQHIYEV